METKSQKNNLFIPETLKIEDLTLEVEDFTLVANFFVNPHERLALWGRSGSGKTTLLRAIAGLEGDLSQSEGKITLGDRDITYYSPQKREIGFVFQEQILFPNLTVLENAVFGLKMRGVSRDERLETGTQWLDRVGLKSKLDSSVELLSVGEKQRVSFVRALVWRPRALLLDEPFSALDPELRVTMRNELLELHSLWPVPLVLVTHDPVEVDSIATGQLHLEWNPDSQVRRVSRHVSKI